MPFKYVKGKDGKPVMPEVCNFPFSPLSCTVFYVLTCIFRAWSISLQATQTKAF